MTAASCGVTRKGCHPVRCRGWGRDPRFHGNGPVHSQEVGQPAVALFCGARRAGRVHSRNRARGLFTVEQLTEAMKGRTWELHQARRLVDESPWSYKPMEQVMRDQEDLVAPEDRLVALINYKGA